MGYEYDYQFDWVGCRQLESNKKEANNNTMQTPTSAKFVLNQKLLGEQNFFPSPVAVGLANSGDLHQR